MKIITSKQKLNFELGNRFTTCKIFRPITRPLQIGVKSLKTMNRLQMNFTCPRAGESCATAEFMLVNERLYRCEATQQNRVLSVWTVTCNQITRVRYLIFKLVYFFQSLLLDEKNERNESIRFDNKIL